jgi:NTE family protein
VGLALSGGGARGLAHIGVLKVLEREGIPIDCLVGTSMGGLIGAVYAAGMTPEAMEAEAIRMSQTRRLLDLVDRALPRRGLLEGERVRDYLAGHLGEATFDDLCLPLALVAVDLISGREIILRQGRVVDAVRATIAIPGLLAPVEMDGYRLVDGGLLNNLPADVAQHMRSEVVIAVDVTASSNGNVWLQSLGGYWFVPDRLLHIADDAQRSLSIMMAHLNQYNLQAAQPDLVIHPAIGPEIGVFGGFTRPAQIIAAGEAATEAALPQIQQAIERRRRRWPWLPPRWPVQMSKPYLKTSATGVPDSLHPRQEVR